MKKIISFILLLSLTVSLAAQSLETFIAENPLRSAATLHKYELFDPSDSPAPEGYEPFYISHYGRHGSRYHSSTSTTDKVLAKLERADAEGILTPDGKELLDVVRRIRQAHEGMDGYLTQVGAAQHQGIATRMYENYKQVFSQPDRSVIHAVSSTSGRCIQSMANFCTVLKAENPALDIEYYSGKKYMSYISKSFDITYMHDKKHHICDSILRAFYDGDRLMSKTFTDAKKARSIIGSRTFFKSVFDVIGIEQNLDEELPDMLSKYFTVDELAAFARSDNARYFATWCISEEFGDTYVKGVGGPLLRDFIEKADKAVAGNNYVADLRFGHDSALTPLLALIGFEGYPVMHEADAADIWFVGKYICMASNLQMIFYRNDSGKVLVKFRRNESDTVIPSLKPVNGCFYEWKPLRKYLLSKVR